MFRAEIPLFHGVDAAIFILEIPQPVASGANTRVGILYRTFSRGLDATDLCIGSERNLERIMTGLVNIHTVIAQIMLAFS